MKLQMKEKMSKQRHFGLLFVFILCWHQPSTTRSQLVCQTSDTPQVVEFLPDDAAPLVAPLNGGLSFGSVLSLEGTTPPDAQEFSVELLVPDDEIFAEQSSMALLFRARFDIEEVYHNSFLKRAWGSEEIPYWFPLQRNQEFNITFQSDDQGFKIDVNGALFWMFFHRADPFKVSHVRVTGDIAIYRLTYQMGMQPICQPPAHLHAQDVSFSGAAPYLSHLHHPFSTGSVISVTGTIHRDAEWMIINLQSSRDIEEVIVLQFNARLRDGAVLQNTFFNGVWGWDFSKDTAPLRRGADFSIDFHSDARHIKVCINGELYSRYEHRLNPERVSIVSVNGAVTLKSVLHYINGTQADMPQSAFKTCSPLGTSASFKNILCQLCYHLPDPAMSVMATPFHFKEQP